MNAMRFSRFSASATLLALLAACASTVPAPVEHRPQQLNNLAAGDQARPGYHAVQKGDTLYNISMRYSQDYRDIAAWNNLVDPGLISVGQVLRVAPPDSASGSPGVSTAPVVMGAVVERSLNDGADTRLKREPLVIKEPYSDAAYARAQNPDATTITRSTETQPGATSETKPAVTATTSGLAWGWPAKGKTVGNFAQTKGIDIAGQAGDPVLAAADGKVVYAGSGLRGYGQLIIIKHNTTYLTAYAHNRKILVKEGQEVRRGTKIAEMGNTDSDAIKLHFEVRKQGKPVEPLDFLPRQ
ncbi:MAG: peptidoglycan DD-metalloendopeptidase family protein [Zoogloeaceae bacterium]|jgi:lipoprotein NlpD|nr:peptidoglycan DD-metalloendopeptidase family protein [Zoogloeaceae bacterium]